MSVSFAEWAVLGYPPNHGPVSKSSPDGDMKNTTDGGQLSSGPAGGITTIGKILCIVGLAVLACCLPGMWYLWFAPVLALCMFLIFPQFIVLNALTVKYVPSVRMSSDVAADVQGVTDTYNKIQGVFDLYPKVE